MWTHVWEKMAPTFFAIHKHEFGIYNFLELIAYFSPRHIFFTILCQYRPEKRKEENHRLTEKARKIILMKFSSLISPKVVKMTTFVAIRDEISSKLWQFCFNVNAYFVVVFSCSVTFFPSSLAPGALGIVLACRRHDARAWSAPGTLWHTAQHRASHFAAHDHRDTRCA